MANKEASFAVRLIDKATRPARAIKAALAGISKAAKASSGKLMGDPKLGRFKDKQGRVREKDGKFVKTKFGDAFKKANAGGLDLIKTLGAAATKAALLGGALALIGAGFVIHGIADATAFVERSSMAFTSLTGSVQGGAAAFKKSIALSRELGLDVQDTTKQYQKLLAAQFTSTRAEGLIKLTTDLKAIGSTAEEASSAIRAITQIKAKGRLQAEELVGQLAEAGVATTLVYEALGKQMGKTQKQVIAAITAGSVSADMGIAAIEEAIKKKVHEKTAGEAGKRFADATLGGMFERLKNAPGQMFVKIAQAGERALPKMKGAVQQLERMIDNIDPGQVALAFERVIDLARTGITLGVEFAGGFAEGFGEISKALQPGDVASSAATFRQLGRDIATIAVYAVQAAKGLGQLFAWFAGDTGRTVLMVGGIALALGKVVGVVGTVAAAFGATGGTGLLASMGAFGVGAAVIGQGATAIVSGLLSAGGAIAAFGSAAIAAIAPVALPFLAAAAAIGAVALAVTGLLKVTGGWDKLEKLGASFAGPAIQRATQRGVGPGIATEGPGYPYAAARPATSALVKRDQMSATGPLAAAGGTSFGDIHLTVPPPSAAYAGKPREYGAQIAEGFKSGLGNMTGATAGG